LLGKVLEVAKELWIRPLDAGGGRVQVFMGEGEPEFFDLERSEDRIDSRHGTGDYFLN
jgi:hypothetical protein